VRAERREELLPFLDEDRLPKRGDCLICHWRIVEVEVVRAIVRCSAHRCRDFINHPTRNAPPIAPRCVAPASTNTERDRFASGNDAENLCVQIRPVVNAISGFQLVPVLPYAYPVHVRITQDAVCNRSTRPGQAIHAAAALICERTRIYEWRVSGLRRGSVVDDVVACLNNGLIIGDVISRIVWDLMPGVAPEREQTQYRVGSAGGKATQGVLPFCRVATGIPSVRCRTDRLRSGQKTKAVKQE
jgi:hypothetical protein